MCDQVGQCEAGIGDGESSLGLVGCVQEIGSRRSELPSCSPVALIQSWLVSLSKSQDVATSRRWKQGEKRLCESSQRSSGLVQSQSEGAGRLFGNPRV